MEIQSSAEAYQHEAMPVLVAYSSLQACQEGASLQTLPPVTSESEWEASLKTYPVTSESEREPARCCPAEENAQEQ